MTVLSIDGGKNVGYAIFTDEGDTIERGVIDFDDWFKNAKPDHGLQLFFRSELSGTHEITQLVVEGFRHDPSIKQGGSLHWASQIEGAVKMLGAISRVPVAVQYSSALSVAMLITGYEKPVTRTGNKKHLPDQDSAWLHGRYFFHAKGL